MHVAHSFDIVRLYVARVNRLRFVSRFGKQFAISVCWRETVVQ